LREAQLLRDARERAEEAERRAADLDDETVERFARLHESQDRRMQRRLARAGATRAHVQEEGSALRAQHVDA
jgi:hypothetical protein